MTTGDMEDGEQKEQCEEQAGRREGSETWGGQEVERDGEEVERDGAAWRCTRAAAGRGAARDGGRSDAGRRGGERGDFGGDGLAARLARPRGGDFAERAGLPRLH